jgi:hypothetical protein
VSLKELEETAAKAEGVDRIIKQYRHSIWGRGDNCVRVAKSLGALDVKELYPDMNYQTLEEFVKEFY